jgi:hypothetical protein
LANGVLTDEQAAAIRARYEGLHPIRLTLAIEAAQRALEARATRAGPAAAAAEGDALARGSDEPGEPDLPPLVAAEHEPKPAQPGQSAGPPGRGRSRLRPARAAVVSGGRAATPTLTGGLRRG